MPHWKIFRLTPFLCSPPSRTLVKVHGNIFYAPRVIHEADLSEQFMRGWGKGGQAVNRGEHCVLLTHVPTAIQVRNFDSRRLDHNRTVARRELDSVLIERLKALNFPIPPARPPIDPNRPPSASPSQTRKPPPAPSDLPDDSLQGLWAAWANALADEGGPVPLPAALTQACKDARAARTEAERAKRHSQPEQMNEIAAIRARLLSTNDGADAAAATPSHAPTAAPANHAASLTSADVENHVGEEDVHAKPSCGADHVAGGEVQSREHEVPRDRGGEGTGEGDGLGLDGASDDVDGGDGGGVCPAIDASAEAIRVRSAADETHRGGAKERGQRYAGLPWASEGAAEAAVKALVARYVVDQRARATQGDIYKVGGAKPRGKTRR